MAIGSLTIQHRVHCQQLRRDIELFLDDPSEYTRENVIDRMYQLEETYKQLGIEDDQLTEIDRTYFVGYYGR